MAIPLQNHRFGRQHAPPFAPFDSAPPTAITPPAAAALPEGIPGPPNGNALTPPGAQSAVGRASPASFRGTSQRGWEGEGGQSVGVLFLYRALDSHPFFPSHVASGRCVLSAAAAGAPAGVVSAFAGPSGWCAGAVLDVAGCAVCASAAPNSWRIGGCAGCCGGRLTIVVRAPPSPFPLSAHQPRRGRAQHSAGPGAQRTAPHAVLLSGRRPQQRRRSRTKLELVHNTGSLHWPLFLTVYPPPAPRTSKTQRYLKPPPPPPPPVVLSL